jgi:hypothetical protein
MTDAFPPAPPASEPYRAPAPAIIYGAPAPRPRRSVGAIVWIVVLTVLFLGAAGGGTYLYLEVQRLQAEQAESERIRIEQEGVIEDQNEMLDQQATFGAAMEDALSKARLLDGVPTATLVPIDQLDSLAHDAWVQRRQAGLVLGYAARVRGIADDLQGVVDAAAAERGANVSGTLGESLLDAIGAGTVQVVYDADEALCGADTVGCVFGEEPTVVHLNGGEFNAEYYDDFLRTLVTYHEFAHVLQFTNPEATAKAATAFGDDWEFMADCYALTVTDGWSLDHRVWVDSGSYWDVSVGYGQVCDAAQRDVIRTWVGETGFHYRPVSQVAA